MAILGDIIEVHHRRRHSRLGDQEDSHSVAVIQELLANYELSLNALPGNSSIGGHMPLGMPRQSNQDAIAGLPTPTLHKAAAPIPQSYDAADQSKVRLVEAYSTHILHVLHVLLHGKWDAIFNAGRRRRLDYLEAFHRMRVARHLRLAVGLNNFDHRPGAHFHVVSIWHLFAAGQLHPPAVRGPYATVGSKRVCRAGVREHHQGA